METFRKCCRRESLSIAPGRTVGLQRLGRRQIQNQQIDRSILEEHRRHRERFLRRRRNEHDKPFEADAPRHGLHRIQAPGQVQVRGYPARRLDPGDRLKRQRGLTARPVPPKRRRRRTRQAAQTEDLVQRAKAGGDCRAAYRPWLFRRHRSRSGSRSWSRSGGRSQAGQTRAVDRLVGILRHRPRRYRQRAQHLPTPARSRSAPPFPEGCKSGLDLRRGGCHRTS